MSYSVLFSTKVVQSYCAGSAVQALSMARNIDGHLYGKPIGVLPNHSPYGSV